jgi:hypothetical protein
MMAPSLSALSSASSSWCRIAAMTLLASTLVAVACSNAEATAARTKLPNSFRSHGSVKAMLKRTPVRLPGAAPNRRAAANVAAGAKTRPNTSLTARSPP